MPSLFHTLGVGSESLFASRQGVDTAGHNIASAQVEGYSRQRVNLAQREPLQVHGLLIGNGVYVGSISRAHDQFIENQINKANQESGRAAARAEGMKSIENIFSPELQSNVSDEVTSFFNSLQELANFPEDFTVRTNVVESAKNLTAAFQRVDTDLKEQRSGLNERIQQTTKTVSDQLQEIANLNVKIQGLEVGQGQEANDLRDQRDRLLRDVSKNIEISYYEDQHGMVLVRGPKQVTLVDRGNAATVGVAKSNGNDGLYNVVVQDWEKHGLRDVTDAINGGSLQSYIEMRDKVIPGLAEHNDEMAYNLSKQFNAIHRQGFGTKEYSEAAGRDFFKEPAALQGAAANFQVDDAIVNSNDAIAAASSALAPGDNVNINQLIKLKDARFLDGGNSTLNEYYGNYVGALGLDVVRSEHVKEASDVVDSDLTKRREAISGVSLDEEATNLMKWQSNFTASSKVITTVDEMLDTVLQLKR